MSKTFDGMPVDEWAGRFSGTFDLEEEQASRYSVDDVIVFVVRAQVKGASVKTTPQGDVKRVHVLGVEEAVIPTEKLWRQCMSELRADKQGKLELPAPVLQDPLVEDDVIHVDSIEAVLEHVPSSNGAVSGSETPTAIDIEVPVGAQRRPAPISVNDPVLKEFLNS